jgi:hypothetical protein
VDAHPPSSTPASVATSSASDRAGGLAWAHYSDNRFDFDYPSAWVAQHHDFGCSFCAIQVELSQVQTPKPCVTVGNTTDCNAFRGVTLSPGEVFAVWWHWGMPHGGIDRSAGEPMLVGGREARLRIGPAEQGCERIADRSFDLQVVSPARDNWEEFHACYHAQDAGQIEPSLQRMLGSVRWND